MVTFGEDKVAIRLCGQDATKNVGVAGGVSQCVALSVGDVLG